MDGDLISDEDYDKLSADDEQCFAELEATCRRNMTEMLDNDQRSSEYYQSIKSQYMSSIYNVALECGITKRRFSEFPCEASCNQEYASGIQQGLNDKAEPVIAQREALVLQYPGIAAFDRPAPLSQP